MLVFMIVFEIYLNLFDLEFSVLFFYKEKYTRPKNWTHLRGFARPTTPDRNQARNRHFSHVTKSRIFKILNLRKKADRNFRRTFLKNRFRHLKLYSNTRSWLSRSCCHMGTFWKTKDWSLHFWESQHFIFWYVQVHCQRRLNSTETGISS